MQTVRGKVGDRPWGVTLAALGLESRTAQLTLREADKVYRVAFSKGHVVGATSPLTADSVARIAMTSHLINSTRVSEVVKRLAAAPNRDEIEVLAEAVNLTPDQSYRLRHRLVAQRAARTFAIERGDYEIEERITIPISDGKLDVRNVIYLGVRMNLSEQRLSTDLRQFGSRFALKPESENDLSRFGFTDAERPILELLRSGATVAEIEARHREIDPRMTYAVVYALASCDAVTMTVDPSASTATTMDFTEPPMLSRARTPTPREPTVSRIPTLREPVVSRVPTPREAMATTPAEIVHSTPKPITVPPSYSRTTTVRRSALAVREIELLIASRATVLERGGDHFALLGVPFDAPVEAIRAAYLEVARSLHPDRLAELGINNPVAQRLWAKMGTAFVVLTDPARRAEYLAQLAAPKPKLSNKELAAEAFRRGQQALRAEQTDRAILELSRACELDSTDTFYLAMLKWAEFCAAFDKGSVAVDTRRALDKAIHKSNQPEQARFYLGRVERMLGRDVEALHHFKEVIAMQPDHAEAAAEIRVIEARLGLNQPTQRTRRL